MQVAVTVEPVAADPGEGSTSAPTSAFAAELAFSLDLALRAGVVLMDHYERLERIDYKSAKDVVTEADHLSEALILDAIRARYPADAILAEETGEHRAKAGEAPTSGRGRVWIVDPLDGTVNYANGLPVFCVSIGLVVDGVPAVGVILDPTRTEAFAATLDGPATLNGRPVRASQKEKLSDYVVAMSLHGRAATSRARNVHKAIRISRDMGSAALALAIRRQRPVRCLRPAGRAVGLGRGGLRADRRAWRCDGHLDVRRPVVRPLALTTIDGDRGRARGASRNAARARQVARSAAPLSRRRASGAGGGPVGRGPIPRRRPPTRLSGRRPSAAPRGPSGG